MAVDPSTFNLDPDPGILVFIFTPFASYLSYFHLVDPDPYSEHVSGFTKLLNMDPIWSRIWIHKTVLNLIKSIIKKAVKSEKKKMLADKT